MRLMGPYLISILLALIICLLPLPISMVWYRPDLVLLVLMFWLVDSEGEIGLLTVWLTGLLVDLSTGTLIGVHCVGYLAVAYVILKINQQLKLYSIMTYYLVMGLLVFMYYLILLLTQTIMGNYQGVLQTITMPVLTILLLPWLFWFLTQIRFKFFSYAKR